MIQFLFAALSIGPLVAPAHAGTTRTCGSTLQNTEPLSERDFRAIATEAAEHFYDENHSFAGERPRLVGWGVERVLRRGPRAATVTATLEVDHASITEPVSIYVVIDDGKVTLTGTSPVPPPRELSTFAKPKFDPNDSRTRTFFARVARRHLEGSHPFGILKAHAVVQSIVETDDAVVAITKVLYQTKQRPNFWAERRIEVRHEGFGIQANYLD